MHVREREKDGVMICYISGEITIDTAGELKKTFKAIVDNKWRKVLLNLKGLSYIDSSGLASFVELSIDLKNIQGAMALAEIPPKIRSIFGITRLERMFMIFETEDSALQGFDDEEKNVS